jgi:xanthine/CO dehydrogenase XdhC/CoxF family maturation factor
MDKAGAVVELRGHRRRSTARSLRFTRRREIAQYPRLLSPIGNLERHVVVASRGKFDEEAVEQALHEQSAYVRLVASKKRGLEILRSLESKGESPKKLDTVHVLAGNNIWAETPEEIALSIAAEMVSRGTEKLLARNS